MALSEYEKQRVIALLERGERNTVEMALANASALLRWLADVVDMGSDFYRRIRTTVADLWQGLRSIFL